MRNLIKAKQDFTSIPLKLAWQISRDIDRDKQTWKGELAEAGLWAYFGLGTISFNIYPAIKLIDLGSKGPRYMDVAFKFTRLGYPMPAFTWKALPSRATVLGERYGGRIGGKIAGRAIPFLGWAMVAYDVYDVVVNRSLWGFDFDSPSEISWG